MRDRAWSSKAGEGLLWGQRTLGVVTVAKRAWESCQVGAMVCASSAKDPFPRPGH